MSFAKEGKTMIYNYYPGCTLSTKAKQLDMAARRCAEVLGFPLVELPEWQCCGAVYPMAPDAIAERLSAVRALVAARENGGVLVTLCSACYHVPAYTVWHASWRLLPANVLQKNGGKCED